MNAKHTATPWFLTEEKHGQIENCKGYIIAKTNITEGEYINEEVANALRIVKCINLHDELVNALEQVKSYLERISCNIPLEDQDSCEIAEVILEALDKAKAE